MSIDKVSILETIRRFEFRPEATRPRLFFGAADIPELRRKAALAPELLARLVERTTAAMQTSPDTVDRLMPRTSGSEGVAAAQAYALTGNTAYAAWAKQRAAAIMGLETWFAHVHKGVCRVCDHCVANIGAQVAVIHDMLGERYSASESEAAAAAMRRLHLEPFLDGTSGEIEWWFKPEMHSNWKIMTCGESGLAICAFVEWWPEANEALARAAQGVIEILDDVPPEGDWPEGIGYWFHTLWMGLRFARALRRLTGGAVDLFQHPVLRVTGDFAARLTTPGGRVYNFADNTAALDGTVAETLAMLAAEHRRGDWMGVARLAPAATPLFLTCAGATVDTPGSLPLVSSFPTTGVASARSGWDNRATFIGLKSGPSDVGHSHLDANSFIIESLGVPLLIDQGVWPYAHFLGFFDNSGPRWDFDANASVAHSTLLVDGLGQTWGAQFPGRILDARDARIYSILQGDASRAYPGLLRKFVRTILLLKPDVVVIRDVVECEGKRRVEWLLQHAGSVRSEGPASLVENEGVRLSVVPFLPDRSRGWRTSDHVRASTYRDSNSLQDVTRSFGLRSFSPFEKAERFEFLFGMRVNGAADGCDFQFTAARERWRLDAAGFDVAIVPSGDGLEVRRREA